MTIETEILRPLPPTKELGVSLEDEQEVLRLDQIYSEVKNQGYTQLVILLDRDGVLFPENLIQTAAQLASESTNDSLRILKSLVNRRDCFNPAIVQFLDKCKTLGIDICPGSRNDWLIKHPSQSQQILQMKWLRYLEQYQLQTNLYINPRNHQLELRGFSSQPLIVFVTDDFSSQEIKQNGCLQPLVKALKTQLKIKDVRQNMLIVNVHSYGRASINLGKVEFKPWEENFDLEQEVVKKISAFLR